jgi:LDH2 family malate/lactate/ureidoglycolate dehydrogenase
MLDHFQREHAIELPPQFANIPVVVLALRVDAVIDPAEFDYRIDDLIGLTKGVPLARGASEIFYPGEIEDRAEAAGRRDGVTLPDTTVDELRELAASCGVAAPSFEGAAA